MDKTSFIDSDTQKQINAPLNGTLIHGTHRICDLIPAMLEAIRDTAEYAQLSSRLPSVVTDPSASEWDDRWQEDDVAYLHEELTDILERYAPEGYYFGTHPGDGSDFGYWRDESYMLGVITESVKEGQTLVLDEDPALTHRPHYSGEPTIINAYQITRNKEGVMVGNKTYMVNINDLDEDSVEKLFKAVKATKQGLSKEPVRENGIYSVDEILTHDDKFRYQLLSRMQSDVKYFLGNGNRHEPDLWAGNVDKHIDLMYKLWDSFKEKPEWLTREEIDGYAKLMRQPGTVEQVRQLSQELKDILLSAGLEYSPLAPKFDITLKSLFNSNEDVHLCYATFEDDRIHLYKNIEDAYILRNYEVIDELKPENQLQLLQGIIEYYRNENNNVTIHIETQQIPGYALPAIYDNDWRFLSQERADNIHTFLAQKKYADAIFNLRDTPPFFTHHPAFGQPTDCVTVDILRTGTIKQFREEHLENETNKSYHIAIGTDNRPGGVEGEYHVKFKPDIMTVTFGEQEEVAKEFGGTMRVTDGQEWADFYHEADAVKFAEKVIGMDQERELQTRFDAFKAEHGEEPLYAEVTIRYKDDGESHLDIIKLSSDADPRDDDKVFFNVTGLNDLKGLINPDNGEDFYIVDVQGITFQPKSLYLNDEKAMTLEQVQEKAVKLFGDNFEFDYWNEKEAGTKIDRIDLEGMPDTISIDKLEIKDGQLSLYSNDIASDVDLQALDDIELSKVDVSLDEIKGYLISSNKEKDLVNRYQAAGMGNGTQFWPDKGTLGIYQAYAFKNNNILVFKDANDNEGIRLSSLPHEEQSRVMDAIGTLLDKHIASKELAAAKAQLVKVLDSSIVDLGDTILIKPTTVKVSGIKTPAKAVFLAPDGKGGGEFRLAGEGYSVLATGKDGHTEFDVSKILDDVSSVNGLMKAVHDVHVAHLEGLAKHAIHDRITNAWQRFFTPDQLKILNRYHQVATPDTPANETFSRLLHEVAQESDVARKPEKWVTDTAMELDGLAEGITRDQVRVLHK